MGRLGVVGRKSGEKRKGEELWGRLGVVGRRELG